MKKRIKKSSSWKDDRYFCGGCHKGIGYLDRFCNSCGEEIEWERCPHCNHISESMTGYFCRDCGTGPIGRM